jgi:serine/threonine protein kinase
MTVTAQARERRVTRRLEARGLKGLGQALVRLRGTQIAGRWELGSLYAVGAEGAVFLCHDVWDGSQPLRVAKIALLPYHKPFALSFDEVSLRRQRLRDEVDHLRTSASAYMPEFVALEEFANPLLDPERGGAFAEPEPVLVMERLPGFDVDYWCARVHSSKVPRTIVRRNVDHVAIVVLRAMWDLHERGYFYCDLRPGNIRIRGRSEHRVRMMDAGSLVKRGDVSGGFPHVPSYLPPKLFHLSREKGLDVLVPSLEIQAMMAGRTLFEVATGRVPVPGEDVDNSLLQCETASADVAETIAGLCDGAFPDVFQALKTLAKQTKRGKVRRPPGGSERGRSNDDATAPEPSPVSEPVPAALDLASVLANARANAVVATPAPEAPAVAAPAPPKALPRPSTPRATAATARAVIDDEILPPSRAKPATWWARLLAKLRIGR